MTAASDRNRGGDEPDLGFRTAVREAFGFLADFGFEEVESDATLVRYRRGPLQADVYHGRRSYEYELGFEVGRSPELFSLAAIISVADQEAGVAYRNFAATTTDEVAHGVGKLARLVERFARPALEGDEGFFRVLRDERQRWSEEYAMDVMARQLRPQAEAAFREQRYADAVRLYDRIQPRLTATERRKLQLARARSTRTR